LEERVDEIEEAPVDLAKVGEGAEVDVLVEKGRG
jgi:hypothetical protein